MQRHCWTENGMEETDSDVKGAWYVDYDVKKEIERLKRDLRCYGSHSNICKIIEGGSAYEQCDCGFEQALKD